MREKYKSFEKYLKDWKKENKDKVKVYNIKSFVRQFIKIKKENKINELGLQDLDNELRALYVSQSYNLEKKENIQEISKNPDDYVSFIEASEILGVGERQITDYLRKGFLKWVYRKDLNLFGKGKMILKKSIEDLQKEREKRKGVKKD